MMTTSFLILACILFFVIAALYSSVGHAGASGYLAIMALLSFAPESIKPTSLILNSIVASIASWRFIKAGYFDKQLFLSFIITAFPMAFIGGYITISPYYFKLMAGVFLIVSAILLLAKEYVKPNVKSILIIPRYGLLLIGGFIGLVSGLIGVGGGIFLSPIMIIANLTTVKKASGVAALFILFNSIAGLLGHITAFNRINSTIFYWILAVIVGGILGSYLGTKKFNNKIIISCLFLVLLSAGLKFILVG
jgi:uncharacterized membrane protein YfcA